MMNKLQHLLISIFILTIVVLVDIGVVVVFSGKITTLGARLFSIVFTINVILNIIIAVNLNSMVDDLNNNVNSLKNEVNRLSRK